MHHFPSYLLQNGALWDMGLVHCGICAMDLLITKNLFLVNKSEFLGIKRSWIEKTYTIDMETWFLFTANKNAIALILGQDLHKGPKRAFLTR